MNQSAFKSVKYNRFFRVFNIVTDGLESNPLHHYVDGVHH